MEKCGKQINQIIKFYHPPCRFKNFPVINFLQITVTIKKRMTHDD